MACPECPHCRLISSIKAEKNIKGKAPFGFLADAGEPRFDVEGNGPYLARIMVANSNGIGTRQLSEALNAQGIKGPDGGEWSYGTVARVIRQGKKLSHLIPLEYVLTD